MTDVHPELREFELLRERLTKLTDDCPNTAIQEARALPERTGGGRVMLVGLKAAILVDAGAGAKDANAIAEGAEHFRRLLKRDPGNSIHLYNLGNALVALADADPYDSADWYLRTAQIRREARAHLQRAIERDSEGRVRSTAHTNIANAFWKAHRWVEAYDSFARALAGDPTNGIAATGAARILLRCAESRTR